MPPISSKNHAEMKEESILILELQTNANLLFLVLCYGHENLKSMMIAGKRWEWWWKHTLNIVVSGTYKQIFLLLPWGRIVLNCLLWWGLLLVTEAAVILLLLPLPWQRGNIVKRIDRITYHILISSYLLPEGNDKNLVTKTQNN